MEAIAAGQRARRTPRVRPWLLASAGALAGFALALAALFAGIGILYLIRDAGAFRIGPDVRGALPLEQLAGQDAQPLFHMLIAWIPAGFCAGLALAALTRIGTRARTLSLAALATVVLMLAGGISDSVAVNDPLSPTWSRS